MNNRRLAAVLAAGTLTATMLATGAPAAAPTVPVTRIQPAQLDRGDDPAVPYVQGAWFVDGDTRVKVGRNAVLVGPAGDDHVVAVPGKQGRAKGSRLLRVSPDGTLTLLRRNLAVWDMVVSTDGSRIFHARLTAARPGKLRTRFRAIDASTGAVLADRTFTGSPKLLGATRTKVYFGEWRKGTFTTNARGARRTQLAKLQGGIVDLQHGLLGGYTGDPYRNGCFKVVKLDRPGRTLWKSCSERVEEFNTDGTGFATVHILSDGIGPSEVYTRTLDGTLTARYRTSWFGEIRYESPATVLLEANGRRKSALVRCTTTACENATDPVDVPQNP
ncbi:MAG: hypothetical protein ACI379_17280 [Nocardioides sp.]|uniref:hypothetical protein n=1 Tax=Nocardioides sp. TaxID=35761 RepID=UPI003F127DF4